MFQRSVIAAVVMGALAFGFQNCGSRLNQAVNQTAQSTTGSSVSPQATLVGAKGCLFTLSSGASGGTEDSTLIDCAKECVVNSGLNPDETLQCTYNGSAFDYVATATGRGCYFFLVNGGAGSTASADRASCATECSQNAAINSNDTLLCYFNGQALDYTATAAYVHPGCYFTLANGGSGGSASVTQAQCQANCQLNANANPGDQLTCWFNDQLQ